MAIKKQVNIEVKESGSKNVEKGFEAIENSIKDVKKAADKALSGDDLKKVQQEAKKTETAFKSVKQRLAEIEDEMAEIGDVGNPQFQKLAKEAGVLKDKVNNSTKAIDAMAADFPKLQLGVQAFQALGAGAQVAMGASMLLGEENEEITKGIQKMMAVQSILNGVNSIALALSDETALGLKVRTVLTNIKTASQNNETKATGIQIVMQKGLTAATWLGNTAMKALNVVMNMNPVFLLISAFAALAAAFVIFGESSESAEEKNESLNASVERLNAAFEKNSNIIKRNASDRRRMLKLQGASEEELHKDTIKRLEEEQVIREAATGNTKLLIEEKKNTYKQALEEEDYELAKSIREELASTRKKYQDLLLQKNEHSLAKQEEDQRYSDFLDKEDDERKAKNKAAQAKAASRYKSFLQEKEDARKRIEDLTNEAIENETARAEAVALTKRNRDIAAAKGTAEQKAKLKELIEQNYQATLTKIAEKGIKERQKLEDDAIKYLAKAKEDFAMEEEELSEIVRQAGQTDRENEEQKINAHYFNLIERARQHGLDVKALEEEQAAKIEAIDKKAADKKKADDKEVLDHKMKMTSDALGALGDLATAFAKDDEAGAKKAFNINKGVGIAQATINTGLAVTAALTAGGNPVKLATGAQFVEAGIAAAAGAAQIATIAKTKFSGGGGAAAVSSPSIGSGGVGGGSQPAQFNVIGNNNTNQLAESLGQQPPVKAFVVSQDVTTQQGLDRSKTDTATL